MRALVYNGPGRISWEEVPEPSIAAETDAVVAVDATTISWSELSALRGGAPELPRGRILGHEAVGRVAELGSAVRHVRVGDRVLVSSVSGCGVCRFCREGRYGQCLGGGGSVLGRSVDGTQAELVRVPYAGTGVHLVPAGVSDEEALMLASVVPAAYEVGVLAGRVSPGDVVAVVGSGPVGLAALACSKLFAPSRVVVVERSATRRNLAKHLGADAVVDPEREDVLEAVRTLGEGLGADLAIEAAGVASAFELAVELVRPGGRVAVVGSHVAPATLHLERIWQKDLAITTGTVDTSSIPKLLELVRSRQLDVRALVTHRFVREEIEAAYETFADAERSGALKVVLTAAG
jgi:alcohol dehydrogenase